MRKIENRSKEQRLLPMGEAVGASRLMRGRDTEGFSELIPSSAIALRRCHLPPKGEGKAVFDNLTVILPHNCCIRNFFPVK